jgi:hypothetical protein
MKISFDISAVSSSSSLSSTATTSVREWIISHTRSLLPSLPASLYDFVPFTLAAIMALLFTALLVLLVEDSDDLGPHHNGSRSRQPGDRPAISHKSNHRSSQRLVGLAERDKDAECGDDDEWEPSPWDPNADMDPNLNLKQSQNWMAIQNAKIATSHGYRTTNKRLLASPNSSASRTLPVLPFSSCVSSYQTLLFAVFPTVLSLLRVFFLLPAQLTDFGTFSPISGPYPADVVHGQVDHASSCAYPFLCVCCLLNL